MCDAVFCLFFCLTFAFKHISETITSGYHCLKICLFLNACKKIAQKLEASGKSTFNFGRVVNISNSGIFQFEIFEVTSTYF